MTWWENERLNQIYTSQGAHSVRAALASALRLPMSQVRVLQQGYVGSGYGYRGSLDLPEIHAAIAAKLTGRVIKNVYTRYEDFVTRTHRPAFRNEVKIGVQKDGTITALQAKIIADVGAQRATAAAGAWYGFQMAYKIPNVMLEGIDVMTNRYLSGAYRCVSHPNGTFALETAMEKAAYAVNMDPVEFRLKNLNLDGNVDAKLPWSNPGIAGRDSDGRRQDRLEREVARGQGQGSPPRRLPWHWHGAPRVQPRRGRRASHGPDPVQRRRHRRPSSAPATRSVVASGR